MKTGMAALAAMSLAGMVFAQGSLTPPGAPGATMKTMDQLDTAISGVSNTVLQVKSDIAQVSNAVAQLQARLESLELRLSAPPAPDGMILIPAGTNSGTDPDFGAYSLTVDAFYMDRSEVTKAQWNAVYAWALTNGYSFTNAGSGKASSHPVHTVNWYDCVKWCNARSEKEGRAPCYTTNGVLYKTGQNTNAVCNFNANGYRLPTAVEWEYAARGGLSSKRFAWGDTITHSNANYYSSSSYIYDTSSTRGFHPAYTNGGMPYTSPSGSFSANGHGLYDMMGDVFEWCWDKSGSLRSFRGGGWDSDAYYARCGNAYWVIPGNAGSNLGFRSVCR
jgi:formylglycine-generating enzyme required for sulfatase activity